MIKINHYEPEGVPHSAHAVLSEENLHTAKAQQLLAQAHGTGGRFVCLCSHHRPLLSVVRRDGRYHLRRLPKTRHLHHRRCLHAEGHLARRPMSKKQEPVIVGDTLHVNINLIPDKSASPKSPKPKRSRRNKIRSKTPAHPTALQGLLRGIWQQAGLHRYAPGMACNLTMEDVNRRLQESAARVKVRDRPNGVYVIGANPKVDERQRWLKYQGAVCQAGIQGLVIGKLEKMYQGETWQGFGLAAPGAAKPIWINLRDNRNTAGLWKKIKRSWSWQLAWLDEAPVYAVFKIDTGKSKNTGNVWTNVRDAAFMALTDDFIPFDSAHEKHLAEILAARHRHFFKPLLRHDEPFLPDFMLTDTTAPVIMEVWGMLDDPDYAERAHRKRAYYQQQGCRLWEWDTRDPMPELPPARG